MCFFVLFGGSGNLSMKKLLPAQYNLEFENMLPEGLAIFAAARGDVAQAEFKIAAKNSVSKYSRFGYDEQTWARFESRLNYRRLGFEDIEDYRKLESELEGLEKLHGKPVGRVYYLAASPEYFSSIVKNLRDSGMSRGEGSYRRLVIEKPFGSSLASARRLNREIRSAFPEESIYRIDHYLGKEMIQNIMSIRFANAIFEPVWNSRHIDNIQISILEDTGIEGRGEYYENSGALRDMVQNHIVQLMSLVMMERPKSLDPEAIRDQKVKIIKKISGITPEDIDKNLIIGQYAEGVIDGENIAGYRHESEVAEDSATETFAALKLNVSNARWKGVSVYVRTGKRLNERLVGIVVEFKDFSSIYGLEAYRGLAPNLLIIKIYPEEGISLQFNMKKPGSFDKIVPFSMSYCKSCEFRKFTPEAYERLIHDVLEGDSTLYARWDEIERAWMLIDSILDCKVRKRENLHLYSAGSSGPKEADRLLEKDGRHWW
ncbi:glucose-6-phosphate dehydrogenase [Peptoclostridium acidaminophilum]|nr:glucose-6-phosphate dehydrogenase [Peptoclostridium acidaminophilum]